MNTFADSNLVCALASLRRARDLIESYASTDLPDQRLVSATYAEICDAESQIIAAQKLEEMQAAIEKADTEPPRRLNLVIR